MAIRISNFPIWYFILFVISLPVEKNKIFGIFLTLIFLIPNVFKAKI